MFSSFKTIDHGYDRELSQSDKGLETTLHMPVSQFHIAIL